MQVLDEHASAVGDCGAQTRCAAVRDAGSTDEVPAHADNAKSEAAIAVTAAVRPKRE